MEIRDTCRPQGEAGNGETVRKRERLEREKKGATTWYVRVGCSRRTYHIGNAVEDIKSSSTICQSPLTGSFHLSSFYSIFIFCPPNVGGLARDVPTPRGDTTRLLTHSPTLDRSTYSICIAKRRLLQFQSPLSLSLSSIFFSRDQRISSFRPTRKEPHRERAKRQSATIDEMGEKSLAFHRGKAKNERKDRIERNG